MAEQLSLWMRRWIKSGIFLHWISFSIKRERHSDTYYDMCETWGYYTNLIQFSCAVMSNSLQHHEPQHARPPCPSPTPGVYSNSCPSSQWCHPTLSSSVLPFCSCLQSLPASGSFPMSQLFASGGQSIGASASESVIPMNNQDWSPLGWTGWISLQSKGLSRVFSNTTVQKHQFLANLIRQSQKDKHISTHILYLEQLNSWQKNGVNSARPMGRKERRVIV